MLVRFVLGLLLFVGSNLLFAQTITVDKNANLNKVISNAKDGDIFILGNAQYHTDKLIIDKEITLKGNGNTKIIGNKKGSVITVNASNVVLEGLVISNSGIDLSTQDSAIFVNKTTRNVLVKNNLLKGNLIGVYLWGAKHAKVFNNTIIGLQDLHENERGNGVQLWNSTGSEVSFNTIRYGRDGIFVTTSNNNIFDNNIFTNLRYSIHYMYTNHSTVSNNLSIGNDIGYALMSSNNLEISNNISINDREHGLFANFLNDSHIKNNVVLNGKGKCLFVYNSNFNTISNNYFKQCLIGVHWTAGSNENIFYNNAFVGNKKQVKYISTKNIEWSFKHRGNYWGNHTAYDINNNGIADSSYRPNDITDKILWKYPNATILLGSPIMLLLKYSNKHFPTLLPGGITDSYPLISPANIATETLKKANEYNN
ncbi:MAG: nitrous oxide reductase family maturation protein NosD [Gammaproteobacteria bacterium]|nr:nitrous oxide reductase family maturation protein NosD [Gammaproteobacteria bacterium]